MAINADFIQRVAEGSIPRYSILKPGTAATGVVVATAATDKLLGTSDDLVHVSGEVVDLAVGKVPMVVLGGTVAVGDMLTANASGAAITTTTTGNRVIGFALKAGVAGDEIPYRAALGVY